MKRLRAERLRRRLSQPRLAAASGIPQTTISAIERGRIVPNARELARLAAFLDISNPDDLLRDVQLLPVEEVVQ